MWYGKLTVTENELRKCIKKDHTSIDEAKSTAHDYDLIVVGENFVDSFKLKEGSKTKIIGLKNLMNKKELEEKLREGGFAN